MKRNDKKKNKKLRREVEVLRAQLKTSGGVDKTNDTITHKTEVRSVKKISPKTNSSYIEVDDKYIKQDLIKSLVLALIGSGIIGLLWYLQIF